CKRKTLTVLKGHDSSISDQRHRQVSSRFDDFWKLMSNVVQRAGIKRCAAIADVQLPANPVILVFNVKGVWKGSENFIFGFRGRSQHEFDRPKHCKGKLIQFPALRM